MSQSGRHPSSTRLQTLRDPLTRAPHPAAYSGEVESGREGKGGKPRYRAGPQEQHRRRKSLVARSAHLGRQFAPARPMWPQRMVIIPLRMVHGGASSEMAMARPGGGHGAAKGVRKCAVRESMREVERKEARHARHREGRQKKATSSKPQRDTQRKDCRMPMGKL